MDISNYIQNLEWDLTGNPARKLQLLYKCCPEKFTQIEYTLKLRRRPNFYVRMLLVPMLLLSVLVLVIFWIPPQRPDRTALGEGGISTSLVEPKIYLLVAAASHICFIPVWLLCIHAFLKLIFWPNFRNGFVLKLCHTTAACTAFESTNCSYTSR